MNFPDIARVSGPHRSRKRRDEPNPKVAVRIQDRYPGHYQLNDTLFLVGSTVETQYIASLLEARMDFPATKEEIQKGIMKLPPIVRENADGKNQLKPAPPLHLATQLHHSQDDLAV